MKRTERPMGIIQNQTQTWVRVLIISLGLLALCACLYAWAGLLGSTSINFGIIEWFRAHVTQTRFYAAIIPIISAIILCAAVDKL